MKSLALEILAYLVSQPKAEDTLEGIAEWWLLEQRVADAVAEVNKALAELKSTQLILARQRQDGRTHYRLNPKKAEEVKMMLKENSDDVAQ